MTLFCMICSHKLNLWEVTRHREFEEGYVEYPAISGVCPKCKKKYYFEKINKGYYQVELQSEEELHVIVDSDFWENVRQESEEDCDSN